MEEKAYEKRQGSYERLSKEQLGDKDEFVLKWSDHNKTVLNLFHQLWTDNSFTDVTLTTKDSSFQAHQLVLSSCSPYFRTLFLTNPTVNQAVFIKDISSDHMRLLLDYMYKGSISVKQHQLSEILESASTLHIRGLTTAEAPSSDGLGRTSPRPLIVDELYGDGDSPLSGCDKFHSVETGSSHSSVSVHREGRKSSMPKRLRLSGDAGGSESSSPDHSSMEEEIRQLECRQHEQFHHIADHPHERSDDGIAVSEDDEEQPMDFTKNKLDTSLGSVNAARFSILGSYLKNNKDDKGNSMLGLGDSGLTGSWLEPLAHLARSAPRPSSRDSRGDSKDEREASGEDSEEKESKDYPQLQLSDSLDLANKLRSHFLANLPAQSYAWLNGMNSVTSPPTLPPSSYPGSWLGSSSSRHQSSLLESVKMDKHPLGGIRTGEIGANGKPTVKCEVCGKKLADPSSLYRHRKIHSGDKPHKCPYCERRFIQRYNMKQHIKTHRIELLADQKPNFGMSKKGRHPKSFHQLEAGQTALDMSH